MKRGLRIVPEEFHATWTAKLRYLLHLITVSHFKIEHNDVDLCFILLFLFELETTWIGDKKKKERNEIVRIRNRSSAMMVPPSDSRLLLKTFRINLWMKKQRKKKWEEEDLPILASTTGRLIVSQDTSAAAIHVAGPIVFPGMFHHFFLLSFTFNLSYFFIFFLVLSLSLSLQKCTYASSELSK